MFFVFFFQAEDGIRDRFTWLEFRRVLFRSHDDFNQAIWNTSELRRLAHFHIQNAIMSMPKGGGGSTGSSDNIEFLKIGNLHEQPSEC